MQTNILGKLFYVRWIRWRKVSYIFSGTSCAHLLYWNVTRIDDTCNIYSFRGTAFTWRVWTYISVQVNFQVIASMEWKILQPIIHTSIAPTAREIHPNSTLFPMVTLNTLSTHPSLFKSSAPLKQWPSFSQQLLGNKLPSLKYLYSWR